MSLWSRIVNAIRPDRVSREIDEELQSHIVEAVDRGRDAAEVHRSFGPALQRREESSDIRLASWLHSFRLDAVLGWRQIIKKKAASAAAVLSLALAIGACTSAFRLIDALLLRPLPIASPERLFAVAFENVGVDGIRGSYDSSSYPMFRRMRDAVNQEAETIAVSYEDRVDLTYGSDLDMEKAYLQYVSGRMFPAFGLRPAAGRLLTANDDITAGAHPLAVLDVRLLDAPFRARSEGRRSNVPFARPRLSRSSASPARPHRYGNRHHHGSLRPDDDEDPCPRSKALHTSLAAHIGAIETRSVA